MQTAKILLVDDDASQRKLNRLRLEDAGYRVDSAADAEEALVRARDSAPDLIVSDVLMGEVDGFGFCRKLDADATLADIPVLLLSAHYGSEADVELARRVGAWTLLRRTSTFETELAAVRTCLNQRGRKQRREVSFDTYERHLRSSANQLTKLVEQTRVAELRALALFDEAADLISVVSPEGIVLEANLTWETMLGVSRDEMIGKSVSELGLGGIEAVEIWRAKLAAGPASQIVELHHFRDRRAVFVEFSVRIVETGAQRLALSIGRDVTEQLQATRKLARTEATYRSMIEQSPDVLFRVDVNFDVEYASPNWERVLGNHPDQMATGGHSLFRSRIHAEDLPGYLVAVEQAFAHKLPLDRELRFRRFTDDRWIWLHVRLSPLVENDRLTFCGVFSDVTARRTLEQSLREAQKMEAIGLLTGGIAHDFNNLLAVIVANSSFLITALAEGDPRRTDAEEIEAAAQRAAGLTRQLLAFSRRQVLQMAVVDLDATVEGLGKMLRRLISENIDLSICSGHVDPVRADIGQLEQVIVNLVVNARDAMPDGGRITLETSHAVLEPGSEVVGVPPGDYVVLAVSDTGSGMTAETKQRLFEPFFTTKEVGRGTGLGLSTCYGIVQQSGGHIQVDSELGQGTVFKIFLPRLRTVAPPRRQRSSMARMRGSETVLLIEDEAQVRVALARMLDELGYRVLVAADGAEALALARTSFRPVDLIVSDVVMPGASGPETITQLRDVSPHARVLMISGYTDHTLLREGVLGEGVQILQKPFAPETLGRRVREILDEGQVS